MIPALTAAFGKQGGSRPYLRRRANALAPRPSGHRALREQTSEGHLFRKSVLVVGLFLGPSSDSICPGTSRDGASRLHAGRHSQPTCLLPSSFPFQQPSASQRLLIIDSLFHFPPNLEPFFTGVLPILDHQDYPENSATINPLI